MIKIKKKESLLIIPAIYPLVLVILSLSAAAALPTNAELTCLSTGSDEVIYIQKYKQNVIIDISDGSYSRLRAASDFAKENGATEFETVMLTHYHNRHVSALSRFTAEEKVRLVILPYPTTEDEAWLMVQIANTLQKSGVGVRVIDPEGEVLITDDINVAYPKITRIERSAHPITYLSFSDGRQRVTYVSSSSWENGQAFECKLNSLVEESNAVLIGAHGPVIKEVFNLPVRKADKVYYFGEDLDFVICPETSLPLDRTTINTSIVRYDFEEAE